MPVIKRITYAILSVSALVACVMFFTLSCASNDDDDDNDVGDAFDPNAFQTTVDNNYFPLIPGTIKTFEGDEDGTPSRVVTEVLTDTAAVAGVTCTVLVETEYEDEDLNEISRNWFAQEKATGNVYYFGEEVDGYEDGEIVSHEGAWKVGEEADAPGLIFPADPQIGDVFNPESVPDLTEETAEIIEMGLEYSTPYGDFTDVIRVEEHESGESSAEWKLYAPGVGLIAEEYESGSILLTAME
jgi:hypothetical protein